MRPSDVPKVVAGTPDWLRSEFDAVLGDVSIAGASLSSTTYGVFLKLPTWHPAVSSLPLTGALFPGYSGALYNETGAFEGIYTGWVGLIGDRGQLKKNSLEMLRGAVTIASKHMLNLAKTDKWLAQLPEDFVNEVTALVRHEYEGTLGPIARKVWLEYRMELYRHGFTAWLRELDRQVDSF